MNVILSFKSFIYILRIIKVLILILVEPHSITVSSLKPLSDELSRTKALPAACYLILWLASPLGVSCLS